MLKSNVEAKWVMLVGLYIDLTRTQVRAAISAIKESDPESPAIEDLKALAKSLSAVASEFEGTRQRALRALEEEDNPDM